MDDREMFTRLLRCNHCEIEREFPTFEAGEQFFIEHNRTHHPDAWAKYNAKRQREIETLERMLA
jgi:hypothetical protein